MSETFHLTGLYSGEKCEWCREHLGENGGADNGRWKWEIGEPRYPGGSSYVIITIHDPSDVSLFKLTWYGEDPGVVSA